MTTWTQAHLDELIDRREVKGQSIREIALAMNRTRNAVIGKCWRDAIGPRRALPEVFVSFEDLLNDI